MPGSRLLMAAVAALAALASFTPVSATDRTAIGSGKVKHILLLSIDGMHAVDFYNRSHGIAGVSGGSPYCPSAPSTRRLQGVHTFGNNDDHADCTDDSQGVGPRSERTGCGARRRHGSAA
jgi:hypothetical protein